MKTTILLLTLSTLIGGCVSVPEQKVQAAKDVNERALSTTPDLSPYVRIELFQQGASPSQPSEQFMSKFARGQAQFDVTRLDGTPVGRLSVQPDDCRDDPNASCDRRFLINGRLQALGSNLSCAVPVRNDTNVGYRLQTLSGLCQSQYGRSYTIHMFPR